MVRYRNNLLLCASTMGIACQERASFLSNKMFRKYDLCRKAVGVWVVNVERGTEKHIDHLISKRLWCVPILCFFQREIMS